MSPRSNPQIARRYAEALFSVVAESDQTAILAEFSQLLLVLAEPDIKRVFAHPRTTNRRKSELLSLIGLSKPLEHFILLVVEKSRQDFLPRIKDEYEKLVLHAQGTAKAVVITAVPLQEATAAELQQRLEKRSGKKVILQETIDPKIGGGLVIKMEGEVIDGSVTHMLRQFRRSLLQ
ncbi:MAG TPA: ATP synthase F1 subunit delta [Firmicutes bacterium]|nr:ATP synthase F1 subunit delta [Bacillota bacterium]